MSKREALQHQSVLCNEAVQGLNIKTDGIYIDATFGRGGHSAHILAMLGEQGQLIALDRDPAAVEHAGHIRDKRFSIIHTPFSRLAEQVTKRGLSGKIDGILFDLGVSSPQLDDGERGFSFMRDGPLDMRMDPTCGYSAAEWLGKAKEQEIAFVLKHYGEERFARRIARAIVERSRVAPILRTSELVEIVTRAAPQKDRGKHPATRSFQAIRIWINRELEEITRALQATLTALAPGGRLSVISFHSLEDRLVKHFIRDHSRRAPVPVGLPLTEAQLNALSTAQLTAVSRQVPTAEEMQANARARSAILRIAERNGG